MKTHMTILLGIVVFGVAIAFSGCRRGSSGTPSRPVTAVDSVYWADSLSASQCSVHVEIEGEYPSAGSTRLLDSIQAWLGSRLSMNVMDIDTPLFIPSARELASGNALAEAAGQGLLHTAASDFRDFAKDSIAIEYEFIYNFGPEFMTDSVATYFFTGYGYMGGAHGFTLGDGQTFNANTGKRLTIASIFRNDAVPRLKAMLRKGLWEQYFSESAPDGASLRDMLLVNPDTLPLPQTPPQFHKDGISFIYQQYEIAPYSDGMPKCVFPYEEMKPLMTPAASRLVP